MMFKSYKQYKGWVVNKVAELGMYKGVDEDEIKRRSDEAQKLINEFEQEGSSKLEAGAVDYMNVYNTAVRDRCKGKLIYDEYTQKFMSLYKNIILKFQDNFDAEGEQDFRDLCDMMKKIKFIEMGVFEDIVREEYPEEIQPYGKYRNEWRERQNPQNDKPVGAA